MRATLEFDLPEDREDFRLATEGAAYWRVLLRYRQTLREQVKYRDWAGVTAYQALEEVRQLFFGALEEAGIDLDRE